MLKTFTIENYKSIERMTLPLGRVNVLIGENGAGKSNILEAIALAGAAQAGKLDNEFLASRGIRAVAPKMMRSAFEVETQSEILFSSIGSNGRRSSYKLNNDNNPYSSWSANIDFDSGDIELNMDHFRRTIDRSLGELARYKQIEVLSSLKDALEGMITIADNATDDSESHTVEVVPEAAAFLTALLPRPDDNLADFVVYSPENSSLRLFEHESQISPLGVRGEGLLKLLTVMEQADDRTPIEQIKSALCMLGWFRDYVIVQDKSVRMDINDRFLAEGALFDQLSANEGFLFIAFYFALFCSSLTPKLFAIDNIDASLNPKLCRAMIERLAYMAKLNDKQVVLTTHNPAVLDGLDLNDDEQRLFVIERDENGRTQAFRRLKPKYDGKPRKLSELFMAGAIGGLPREF